MNKWMKRGGIFGGLWFGLFVGDTILNDDFDVVFVDKFRRKLSFEEQKYRPKVVLLGTGWGSLSMLRKLHADKFDVTVISPRNYFLFTPLLPSATVGTLHQRSIVEPIRQFFTRSQNANEAQFIEAECTNIDFENNKIHCADNSAITGEVKEFDMKYDHLIVAVGCESATFNIPGVTENGLFMKEIKHSYAIRDRILDSLETANLPGQPITEIDRLLHFIVVGGGPSGIEFSAELHDFLKRDIKKNYPEQAKHVKLTLVEALPHVLTMFDASLINETEKTFKDLNINLLLNAQVKNVSEKQLTIKNAKDGTETTVPYGVLVWVTGNTPRKLTRDIMMKLGEKFQKDRRGLQVDGHFLVNGTKNVWAIGDCSINPKLFPPTAQVAYQEGAYLGRLFNSNYEIFRKDATAKLEQALPALPEFHYRHFGSFAYIGDHKAIAQLSDKDNRQNVTASGATIFFLWRSVYFSKLLSYKNRFMVATDWLKTFFFGRDVSRAA